MDEEGSSNVSYEARGRKRGMRGARASRQVAAWWEVDLTGLYGP